MAHLDDIGLLSSKEWDDLQAYLGNFEKAWKEAVGQGHAPPQLGDFLPPLESPFRAKVLSELVKTDLDNRWDHGETPDLDSYLRDYKELGSSQSISPKLIFEEYRIRVKHGMKVKVAEYQRRFPLQFDEFQLLLVSQTSAPTPSPIASTAGFRGDPMALGNAMAAAVVGARIRNYELLETVGEGGFAEVWKARSLDSGIEVAVKIFKKSVNASEVKGELNSLEMVKHLRHPFLLAMHDYFTVGQQLYVVMELATGGTLKDRLKECKTQGQRGIPVAELLRYFQNTAEALNFLHTKAILHRDIKPANILRVEQYAKLGDFSLAKQLSRDETTNQGGTLAYQAPEMFDGTVMRQSDQYCLAYTYAELRLGKLVFDYRTPGQLMRAHMDEKPNLVLLPAHEQEVLLRALAKKPDERFGSCVEFINELGRAIRASAEFKSKTKPVDPAKTQPAPLPTPTKPGAKPSVKQKSTAAPAPPPTHKPAAVPADRTDLGTMKGDDQRAQPKPAAPAKLTTSPAKQLATPLADFPTQPSAAKAFATAGPATQAAVPQKSPVTKPAWTPAAETPSRASWPRWIIIAPVLLAVVAGVGWGLTLLPSGSTLPPAKIDVPAAEVKGRDNPMTPVGIVKTNPDVTPSAFDYGQFKVAVGKKPEVGTEFAKVFATIHAQKELSDEQRTEVQAIAWKALSQWIGELPSDYETFSKREVAGLYAWLKAHHDDRPNEKDGIKQKALAAYVAESKKALAAAETNLLSRPEQAGSDLRHVQDLQGQFQALFGSPLADPALDRVALITSLAEASVLFEKQSPVSLRDAKQTLEKVDREALAAKDLQNEWVTLRILIDAALPEGEPRKKAEQLVALLETDKASGRRVPQAMQELIKLQQGGGVLDSTHIRRLEQVKTKGGAKQFNALVNSFIEQEVKSWPATNKDNADWKSRQEICAMATEPTLGVHAFKVISLIESGAPPEQLQKPFDDMLAALGNTAAGDKVKPVADYARALALFAMNKADEAATLLVATKADWQPLPAWDRHERAARALTAAAKAQRRGALSKQFTNAGAAFEQLDLARAIYDQAKKPMPDGAKLDLVLAAVCSNKANAEHRKLAEQLLQNKDVLANNESARYPLLAAHAELNEDGMSKLRAWCDIVSTYGNKQIPDVSTVELSREVLSKAIQLGQSPIITQALKDARDKQGLARVMGRQAALIVEDEKSLAALWPAESMSKKVRDLLWAAFTLDPDGGKSYARTIERYDVSTAAQIDQQATYQALQKAGFTLASADKALAAIGDTSRFESASLVTLWKVKFFQSDKAFRDKLKDYKSDTNAKETIAKMDRALEKVITNPASDVVKLWAYFTRAEWYFFADSKIAAPQYKLGFELAEQMLKRDGIKKLKEDHPQEKYFYTAWDALADRYYAQYANCLKALVDYKQFQNEQEKQEWESEIQKVNTRAKALKEQALNPNPLNPNSTAMDRGIQASPPAGRLLALPGELNQ